MSPGKGFCISTSKAKSQPWEGSSPKRAPRATILPVVRVEEAPWEGRVLMLLPLSFPYPSAGLPSSRAGLINYCLLSSCNYLQNKQSLFMYLSP